MRRVTEEVVNWARENIETLRKGFTHAQKMLNESDYFEQDYGKELAESERFLQLLQDMANEGGGRKAVLNESDIGTIRRMIDGHRMLDLRQKCVLDTDAVIKKDPSIAVKINSKLGKEPYHIVYGLLDFRLLAAELLEDFLRLDRESERRQDVHRGK